MDFKRSIAAPACVLALAGCVSAPREPSGARHRSFWQSMDAYEDFYATGTARDVAPITEKVDGMVLPHHLFVGHEIARAYNALSGQRPSVVVVVGPNHFGQGKNDIQTTDGTFETPYGALEPDTRIVDGLVAKGLARIEPATFDGEHSISVHVAFIKKTFPDATVVPLALQIGARPERIDELAAALDESLPRDALVIASADFSHYLRADVAAFHDAYSHAAIERFSFDDVARLEIDSPESIRVLLKYLHERDAGRIVYDRHTNSADFTVGIPPAETTSHFFLAFAKGKPVSTPFATVQFFGDTIVGRGIGALIAKGIDPLAGIRGTEDRFFRGATVGIVNLEGPITTIVPTMDKPILFAFDKKQTLDVLKTLDVRVANVANNHARDAGEKGLADTVTALTSAGIAVAGEPKPCVTVPIVGGTMAVCSFTDIHGFLEVGDVADAIASVRADADFVLVSLHWGVEYADEPMESQRAKAKAIIAAGADAIVGHGPHVAQPIEWIDGKPVFYSIGNFLFDQPDPSLSSGLVAGITFTSDGIQATGFPITTTTGNVHLRKAKN